MSRLKTCIIFFLCVFSSVILIAQEPKPIEEFDLATLPVGWWSYFKVENGENLQEKLTTVLDKINSVVENLEGADKERAEGIIGEIKLNFQNYAKISSQSPPPPPSTPPIAETYTIEGLIDLNNNFLKQQIDIKTLENEVKDIENQSDTIQARIDVVRQQYNDAEARSPKKLIAGLELIQRRSLIETNKKKALLTKKAIESESKELKFFQDEIKAAKTKLVSSETEMSRYARMIEPARLVWSESKQQRQKREGEITPKISEEQTEVSETNNQNLNLQLMEARITEAKARNQLVRAEILFTLSRILVEPESVSYLDVENSLKDWYSLLQGGKQLTKEWIGQAERNVKRASDLISLQEQDPAPDDESHIPLLKEVLQRGQNNIVDIRALDNELGENQFLIEVVRESVVQITGQSQQWIRYFFNFVPMTYDYIREQGGKTLFHLGTHPINFNSILQFIFILFVTWWISLLIQRGLNTLARNRKGIRKSVVYRLNRLLHYAILTLGVFIALATIGFDFSNFFLIAGALGVGLGFGLQGIVRDFISGLIILFQSYLKVGDYIELDHGVRGEIREINVRSTVVTTNDGLEVLVPNSQMIGDRIINWTLRDPYRRVKIPFSVAYGSDIDQVEKIIVSAAQKVPSTLQKIGVNEPRVYLAKFGDSGIEMELVVWVSEKWTRKTLRTKSAYLWAIERALREAGFTIPFPQRDIHVVERHED